MKKSLSIFLSLCFLFLTGNLFSQNYNLSSPIPPDTAIRIGQLDNGLTYYIKYNKIPEKRMEIRLAVNAGSICETDAQQGLAHFCEHMCFNGTESFPRNKMVDLLEEMGIKFGADINAGTSFDQTVYQLKIPTDKPDLIEKGFQIAEEWAHKVSFTDEDIESERNVILEEWRLGLGAEERMQQQYMPVLFKGSKYAERLPIGKVDVIKNAPYDTLRAFYKTWYRPDLMALVVVGDIDPMLAEQKVKEYFNRIPAAVNPQPRVDAAIPGNDEPLISIVTDKEATGFSASVLYKHPAADKSTYGAYRNQLKQSLYNAMLNQRLQEIALKPDSPFLYAGTGYGSFIGRTIDVYSLFVAAKENQIDKGLERLMTENERALRFGFTATELERAKKNLLTYYEKAAAESDKTQSAAYAEEFVRNYMDKESIPGIKKENEIVKNFLPGISLEEINQLGPELTGDKNIIVLVTAPDKAGNVVPSEQDIRNIIAPSKSEGLNAYVDQISEEPLLPAPPKGSPVVKRKENKDIGFTELVFANGVKMYLKPTDFKNDEILLSAYSPGGTSLYPDSDIMSAIVTTSVVMQGGLGTFDQAALQKKLTGNTANLSPYINETSEGVSGNCSPKDFETLLQLNYLYFTGIRKDEDAYAAYISRIENVIKPMRSTPRAIFSDTLTKITSMNSPRAFAIPSDAQLASISLDRCIEIYKDRFADAGDFSYFMVGNFKVDEVIPMLETYIGGLPATGRKENWKDVEPGFPSGLVKVDVPVNSEPQALVSMQWKGSFKWKLKDRVQFDMLMDILSITCRESMREDQGGVYGVSINGSVSRIPKIEYSIDASWGCSPENVSKLSQTVLDEMNKIIKNGPTEEDLNKVKETDIRDRESAMKENSFWLGAIRNSVVYDSPVMSLEEYKKLITSVKQKDIQSIAVKYLDTNDYVEVALTPAGGGE
ncbi:MAG: insulinase family protein [Bacteroidales bacterium]|nr:insulinase family protein [Bacteroidales bacterium]